MHLSNHDLLNDETLIVLVLGYSGEFNLAEWMFNLPHSRYQQVYQMLQHQNSFNSPFITYPFNVWNKQYQKIHLKKDHLQTANSSTYFTNSNPYC